MLAILGMLPPFDAPLAAQESSADAPNGGSIARPRYAVARAAAPPEIDGVVDEATWGEPLFRLAYETRPGDNVPPRAETLGWISFDHHHLYFAFRCLDPEPAAIRARFTDRDRAFQDDFVGVVLDTFDDERRAFEFFVNPLGVQMDLVQNDVTRNEDESWDAIWRSAGRVTPDGYEVEAAIPLSSLRFPRGSKATGTWGLDAVRIRPRSDRQRIGLVPIPRGSNCYLCHEAKLDGLTGIEPGRDLELDPTLVSYRTDARDPFPDGPYETVDDGTEAGLTASWGITPDLTLLGTLNPDFSQIEADAAQLEVNQQFALFYSEKRPFFLEGADYFDTDIEAVYTRNIADPKWGLKLSGKQSANAVGLVVAEDRITNLLLPSAQGSDLASLDRDNLAFVGRYRRDVGKTSTVGGVFTSREGRDYFNHLAGADAQFRFSDADTLTAEAMFTETAYPDAFAADHGQESGTFRGHALTGEWSHSVATWRGFARYEDYAPGFRADLGFVPRVGYRHAEFGAQRIWEGNGERWYTHMEAGGNYEQLQESDGELIESELEAFWSANGPLQSYFNVDAGGGKERYAGLDTHDRFVYAYAEAHPTGWLYLYGELVRKWDGFDYENLRRGDVGRFNSGLRFDLGRHLRLTVDDRYERLDVDAGRVYTANLVEVRATWQFDLRAFVRVVSQYFEIDRSPGLYLAPVEATEESLSNQLLFSYKLNPQTVLFAGYSDRSIGDTSLDLTRSDRTVFLKLGYALRF